MTTTDTWATSRDGCRRIRLHDLGEGRQHGLRWEVYSLDGHNIDQCRTFKYEAEAREYANAIWAARHGR